MSDALNRLEDLKNRIFTRDLDHCAQNDRDPAGHLDHVWQIVVIDLAGSTLRLLKELEEPQYAF